MQTETTQSPPAKFKVAKVMRVSSRRQILARHLTEPEAQRMVARYSDSTRSMVCYFRE